MILFGLCVFAACLDLSVAGANFGWALILFGLLTAPAFRDRVLPVWRANILFWPWILYLTIAVLSAFMGVDAKRGLMYIIRWDMTHALVYFLLLSAVGFVDAQWARICYLTGAAAAAGLGIMQVIRAYFQEGRISDWDVAHGTVHHVTFGELLALSFALCLSMFLFARKGWEKFFLVMGLLLIEAGLIGSQARGAWLAVLMILGVCFAAYPAGRRRLGVFIGIHLVIFGAAILGSAKIRTISGSYIARASSIFSPTLESNRIRLVLWRVGLRMFRDHPVLGLGPGGVREEFARYHPEKMGGELDWGNLHNLYLHQLAERGALGFLALTALFAAMLRLVTREFKKGATAERLCALAVVPGFLLMNVTETSFQHAVVAFSLGWLLALAQS